MNGPLPSQSEPTLVRVRRRLAAVSLVAVLAVLLLLTAPGWLLLTALLGLLRPATRFGALRTGLALTWAAVHELSGVTVLTWGWVSSGFGAGAERLVRHTHGVQAWWCRMHLAVLRGLFGLPLQVEGLDAFRARPTILLMRHTSMLDTVLPPSLLVPAHGVNMRYVLKRELLVDPCLDIAGNRIPNVFVRRGAKGAAAERELEHVRQLAATMADDDVVVLFPEGTRASARKRERALARIGERAASGDARAAVLLAKSQPLRHLMPLRLGGAVSLLRGRPDADVVFASHTGFEELAGFSALMSGTLVGTTIRVRFRRVEGPAPSRTDEELEDWLLEQWLAVDQDVEELRG